MNKTPAFQFYAKDFLSDENVAAMTMEERGVYITLLSHCWLQNGLTTVEEKLEKICHNPVKWKETWQNVKVCFYEKNGKFHHKRLDFEREKQKKWREKSKQGGLKSAKNKALRKGGSQVVDNCLQPNGNTSVSSLQSPVSSLQSSVSSLQSPTPKDKELKPLVDSHKSTKTKKQTNPDIKIFIDDFFQTFQNKTGGKYLVTGKDAKIVQRLLGTYSLLELKKLQDLYFNSADAFVLKAGYSIPVFSSVINKLISKGKSGQPGIVAFVREMEEKLRKEKQNE